MSLEWKGDGHMPKRLVMVDLTEAQAKELDEDGWIRLFSSMFPSTVCARLVRVGGGKQFRLDCGSGTTKISSDNGQFPSQQLWMPQGGFEEFVKAMKGLRDGDCVTVTFPDAPKVEPESGKTESLRDKLENIDNIPDLDGKVKVLAEVIREVAARVDVVAEATFENQE